MTRGDPLQSTVSVLYYMYEEGFKWWSLGRASAIAFILFAITLLATRILLWIGRRGEANA
jgi:multiple sugar transport system permease protein